MKNRVRLCIIIFVSVIFFGYNNCSKIEFNSDMAEKALRTGETVVGNPMTTAAKTLLAKVCSVITRCSGQVTKSQCETGVLGVTGIDYQLGLVKGSFAAFSEIMQAEDSGTLMANSSAVSSCLTAIDNLSCTDSTVQGAYDASANSFDGVAFLIPTSPGSCPAIFNQPPSRREYYVTTTGNDGDDGSVDRPWATINHAAQTLQPTSEGAIVHVAPGNYTLPVSSACSSHGASCGVNTARSGLPGAPIIYISDQQGAAKIVAPGASATWYNSGDYVQIIGFEIVGTASSNFGILSEAAFGKMIGNHVHDIPVTAGCATGDSGAGIFFGYLPGAHDNDAIGNRIHDIGPRPANGLPQSSYCPGMSNGIFYNQPRGKIQNNIIYAIDNWAINTFHSASDLQISHNLLFNNGHLTSDSSTIGGAIFISGEVSVGIHDNTTVSNNIIRNNNGKGLNEWVSVGKDNAYINNILFSNGIDFDVMSGSSVLGTITSDPLLIGFNINGSGDYRLQSSSPAIDAGSSNCAAITGTGNCTPNDDFAGSQRPFGSGLDIGPYEWHP